MNFRIDWIDGAPDETHEGQIILWPDNTVSVIGCEVSEDLKEQVHEGAKAWAWVLQPHQLDWIADMAQRHGKGRPEE